MKDYYQMDIDEFRRSNYDILKKARLQAPAHADVMGMSESEYVDYCIREEHKKHIASMGIEDPYEYFVKKHEENHGLALKIIEDRRRKINDHLGIED